MMNRVNPNWIAITLAAFTLFVLGVAAISLQQETTTPPVYTGGTPPDVEYTLKTGLASEVPMAFIGVGGDINEVVNPTLTAQVGQTVKITVINEHGIMHDFTLEVYDVTTGTLLTQADHGTVIFTADKAGEFKYYCTVPGHEQVGMVGTLIIEENPES